ncbi:single-stranded DNA-binding protein [Rodentibacter caecimuris]|uniref:Single-stranded DNA-binding protein n=1 Tax=Rodentibacter caecimuris TaxID=1796644 RepID=A0AAJ3K1K1_9PAST|nr:single-stranded DNA-binding protein [Rodentibacter heylii]OOF69540.1 DNA-binding protein [Rodentibacter heylii]OOF73112.1 DNA-binding protein [Rodentibacter heylii]
MSNQNLANYVLKVQIFPTSKVEERSGVSEKTGKNWYIRTQEAYIHLGGQFPVQVKVPLAKDQVPYGSGDYYVHPQSFKTSAYFDLKVGDIVLVPADEK